MGLVYLLYRRMLPSPRLAAGVFLWQRALGVGQSRRRVDLRVLWLMLAALLLVLALAEPYLPAPQGPLAVVIEASASMRATDKAPSRFAVAKEAAAKLFKRRTDAVLVRAGLRPQVYGPAPAAQLLPFLDSLQAGDAKISLAAAIAAAESRLPGAPVVVIGDLAPRDKRVGFVDVAGEGRNLGITAIGADFLALANASPGPWKGMVRVNGRDYILKVPANGYATLHFPRSSTVDARLPETDALSLDNLAFYRRRTPRVELARSSPALERLLGLIGTHLVHSRADLTIRFATPGPPPDHPTLFFATQANSDALVFGLEPTLPALSGVILKGTLLPVPPKPAAGWRPAIWAADGRTLAYSAGRSMYLPEISALQDLPAFPVLVYNLLLPFMQAQSPLGTDGHFTPGVFGGVAYNLASPRQTFLPRAQPGRPPQATRASIPLSAPLALLSALMLAFEPLVFRKVPTHGKTTAR